MAEPVTSFSGEHAFLSSFAQIPFTYCIPGLGLVTLPDREHCARYETSLPVWAGMTFHGHNWLGRSLMAARHFLC